MRPALIDWSQGTPLATGFGDVYFSRSGGNAEAIHVFLAQNFLPERFGALPTDTCFTIIETGFGTGLNWLSTLELWQRCATTGWLHFVSVEKHPLTAPDLKAAHDCWPQYASFAQALQAHYPLFLPGFHRLVFPQWRSSLTLFWGDISEFLPCLPPHADAWFLDGFAPSRNPHMWTKSLYQSMAAHSTTDTTFATFTAAGHVRRGLAAAGFSVEKTPGFGEKREMLRGRFAAAVAEKTVTAKKEKPWLQRPPVKPRIKKACVIGAGIAGASTAHRLALRGWQVTVLESAEHPASGASGNPAAILYPTLTPADQALDGFSYQAWHFALNDFSTLPTGNPLWHPCGVLQLLVGNQHRQRKKTRANLPPADVARLLSAEMASEKAGILIAHEALWHPEAGWLDAAAYCHYLLSADGISLHTDTEVVRLEYRNEHWLLWGKDDKLLHESHFIIIANSISAKHFAQTSQLPLQAVRGQISCVPSSALSAGLETVICHEGYLTPALPDGQHCLGATFYPDDMHTGLRMTEHAENRELLKKFLPELATSLPATATWQGRAALRCQSPDYLPLVGPMADHEKFRASYAGLRDGKVQEYPALATLPGLYVNLAHGAKGFTQAALAAEILAAEISGEPAPVSQKMLDTLHPLRFWERQLKRRS